ncbi:EAL domain-containing protein [Gammaproteobacteria bacterium AB-CW1]|uniref:cyclic-guanylate-specific phosphodiesterase n=1 Tax=Natronospira elongata TaxID=3110268 RepID=A0AAP6MJW2_9GAMM|nr:EAL domain-containing protein [Gammaproteobacteria bacterium AB-CW1]
MSSPTLPRWLRHRRLSLRVILVILLISGLFTLITASYQLYSEYRREYSGLEQRLQEAEASFGDSLARSVWALDENLVALQLQGIAQIPHVTRVEIRGDIEARVGESSDYPHQLEHFIPVVYTGEDGIPQALGNVRVEADLRGIHERLWSMGLVILASQAIKTFSVSLILLFAFYYLVTRHLQALARFARRLRLDRLGLRPKLARPEHGLLRPDELDDVREAFDHAIARIRRDFAARNAAERERNLLASALEQSPVGVVIMDAQGRVKYLNPRFIEFSGCSNEEVLGRQAFQPGGWFHQRISLPRGASDPWETVQAGEEWQGELRFRRQDGQFRWCRGFVRSLSDGDQRYFLALLEDTTQLRAVQERLDFHTRFDPLTELPNQILAYEYLAGELNALDGTQRLALLFLDLDNFKYVNDSLGHGVGDELLNTIAGRLRRYSDDDWIPARFGSDEFLVIVPSVGEEGELVARLEALMNALREPMILSGENFFPSVTGGAAIYPDAGDNARALLQAADTALYAAKAERKNSLRFYDPQLGVETQHRLTLESDLRQALAEGQFELHYQPVIDLNSGQPESLEALIRWRHPSRGLIPPDEFIPLTEENGLILPIGEWVLRTALGDLAQLRRTLGLEGLTMAVNLSPRQLVEGDLSETISDALQQVGLPGDALQLELTERLFLEEYFATRQKLKQLEGMGIALVVDDFGTGYSALAYLRRFHVNTLKVDREFVRDISEDEDDALLTQAIISLAHDLKIQVVAEGVETAVQLNYLRQCGCEKGQGYYFARPMPFVETEAYLLQVIADA